MNSGKLLIVMTLSCILPMPTLAAEIFLVRHAEKQVDNSRDPALTQAGLKRASDLADLLASADIRHVYTSNYRRTRLTAVPSALQAGLELRSYEISRLPELARELTSLKQNALVVGHSNTTPELVKLLGGEAGSDIPEWQYDRVYLLRISDKQAVDTLLLHLPPMSKE